MIHLPSLSCNVLLITDSLSACQTVVHFSFGPSWNFLTNEADDQIGFSSTGCISLLHTLLLHVRTC